MIKLAIFDVDGTLVTKGNRRVPASCVKALNELSRKGVRLAIASGRPPFAMEQSLLEQVKFDYFVCSNGAFVRNAQHEVLYHYSFSMEETRSLIHAFKKTDNALMFQCQDAAHCYHGYKRIANMLQNFLGRLDILVDERESDGYQQSTMPLAAVAKIEDCDLAMMKEKFPQFLFIPFDESFYDINGMHNKATGVAHICEAMGWEMQEVISFGDDYNDLEMIRACGIGVAMGDARSSVKDAADYITGMCSKDGIANALLHYGLIDEECIHETISK